MSASNPGWRPIFVVGCPRSGTTLVGSLLGTSSSVLYAGELAVLYFADWVAPREFARTPSAFREAYLRRLRNQSHAFFEEVGQRSNVAFLCDSTPWNFRILQSLDAAFPNAMFVVTVRSASGVVQSMRRSYQLGYRWAGPEDSDRLATWCEAYEAILGLAPTRVVPFSYDHLCIEPRQTVERFLHCIRESGGPTDIDLEPLMITHANPESRPTTLKRNSSGGLSWTPIAAYSDEGWRVEAEGPLGRRARAIEKELARTLLGSEVDPQRRGFDSSARSRLAD